VLGPEALGQKALVSGALAPEGLVPALQREAFAPVALVPAREALVREVLASGVLVPVPEGLAASARPGAEVASAAGRALRVALGARAEPTAWFAMMGWATSDLAAGRSRTALSLAPAEAEVPRLTCAVLQQAVAPRSRHGSIARSAPRAEVAAADAMANGPPTHPSAANRSAA
jgi:hypothetical protein